MGEPVARPIFQRPAARHTVFVDIRPDTLNIDESKIEAAITDRTVDATIKRLRQKLGPEGAKHIVTIEGFGYKFE